jgi:hypothetical protein
MTATNSPPDPATIGVLVTDAYGTRWDEAWATITSIELIGDDSRETLFTGTETIDLLSLSDYSELFALADIFPATFSKARLQLLSLELVDLDEMGVEIERVATKLVGNGKMDIKFHEPLVLFGGESLLIEFDFDMNKTFKVTETGSGMLIVRPVIHARVTTTGMSSRMVRIFGMVRAVDYDAGNFVLCQSGLAANHDDDDFDHCLLVEADDLTTAVFSAEGLPVTVGDVAPEMKLTAIGFLRHVDDDDDDDDGEDDDGEEGESESDDDDEDELEDDFVLDAVVIEIGENFERYSGTVQPPVDGMIFDFSLADGQGFDPGTVITTELFANTPVYLRDGTKLDQSAIVPGATGMIDGIIDPRGEGADDDLLRAALVVLDPAEDEETLLTGTVISEPRDGGRFDLMVGMTPWCVAAGDADIRLVSEGDEWSSDPGDLTNIGLGRTVDVFGVEGIDGCFIASSVFVHVGSTP